MAFNFPDAPTYGQVYQFYTWDGEKWISTLQGVPAFSPMTLTGLIGWWDASVAASLTLTGSSIDAVADQSGVNNHLAWTGAKPVYDAIGFNNRPAFIFGGTQAFDVAVLAMPGASLTFWYVGTISSGGFDFQRVVSYTSPGSADNEAGSWNLNRSNVSGGLRFENGVAVNASGITAYPAPHRVIVTVNSGVDVVIYVDGVAVGSGWYSSTRTTGGRLVLGGRPGGFNWIGPVGEAGVATGGIDATVAAALDAYLAAKWPTPPVVEIPPTSLTGLIGWWDASVTSSLTLSSGTSIDAVADQSGGGNHLAWSVARPTYSATEINLRPGMIFSVGQALQKTSFPMGTGNTLTFFYVGTLGTSSSQTNGRVMSYAGTGASNDYADIRAWNVTRLSAGTAAQFQRNAQQFSAAGAVHPAVHRVIGTIDLSGVMTLYINGVPTGGTTSSGNWTTNGSFTVARNSINTAEYFAGSFAEIGVATGYSNVMTVAGLDLYLKNKWGL